MHNVDVRNVSLGQIMYFIKVAESMNISETAEFFHLTQPVLSKKIASLERQLDLQLFIRTNRIAALTPAGKYLYEKWKHIVSHIEEEIQQAHILQTGKNKSLVVACMDSYRPDAFLLPLTECFRYRHPDIHLRVEADAVPDIRRLLQRGEADVIFSIQYDFTDRDMEQVEFRKLGVTQHCACMRKDNPLAQKKSLTMKDLQYSEFICISPQTLPEYVRMLHELCSPYGFVPDITGYVSSAISLTMNLKSDREVFICDRYYVDGNDSEHVRIPIEDTQSAVILAWRKDNEKKYLQDFIQDTEKFFEEEL